jgi:hypothetical protein
MGFRGVSVRQSGDRIIFRASLKDSAGAKLASGTTALRLFEQQPDGSLKSFDWNDFTFKTTALTTDNRAMTHRTGNNGTYNTGIWTATLLSTEGTNTGLNGFTIGNIYLAQASNAGAVPLDQEREFQYGGAEGDLALGQIAGSVNDTAPTAAGFKGNSGLSATDSFYSANSADSVLVFTSGVLSGLARKITGYTGSTRALAFAKAWPVAPANGDSFVILGLIEA